MTMVVGGGSGLSRAQTSEMRESHGSGCLFGGEVRRDEW